MRRFFKFTGVAALLASGCVVAANAAGGRGGTPFWLQGSSQFNGPFWLAGAQPGTPFWLRGAGGAHDSFNGLEGPQVFIGDTNTALVLLSPLGTAEQARLDRENRINQAARLGMDPERLRQFGSEFVPGPTGIFGQQGRGLGIGQQGGGTVIGPQVNEPMIGQQGSIAPTPQGSSLVVAPNGTFAVPEGGAIISESPTPPLNQAGSGPAVSGRAILTPTGRGAGHR